MGITKEILSILIELSRSNRFKSGSSVIELGAQDIHVSDKEYSHIMKKIVTKNKMNLDKTAAQFYNALGIKKYVCIDLNGKNRALPLDLSLPIDTASIDGLPFELVTDFGTIEHLFNPAEAFKTMHDLCAEGGLMLHQLPFQGQVDHGFYSFHPTLFVDMAVSNGYSIEYFYIIDDEKGKVADFDYDKLPDFSGCRSQDISLFIALQKRRSGSFIPPYQNFFASSMITGHQKTYDDQRLIETARRRTKYFEKKMGSAPKSIAWRMRDRISKIFFSIGEFISPRNRK